MVHLTFNEDHTLFSSFRMVHVYVLNFSQAQSNYDQALDQASRDDDAICRFPLLSRPGFSSAIAHKSRQYSDDKRVVGIACGGYRSKEVLVYSFEVLVRATEERWRLVLY